MTPWVAIEITRQMRLADGKVADAGALAVGGVNLLAYQVGVAMQVAPAERVVLLAAQSDEALLEQAANRDLRLMSPLDFINAMRDRAAEGAPVLLLRQCVPLRDAADARKALTLLEKHEAVVSASKPPAGHRRHQPVPGETEPDYRCLAFEARRASQFLGQLGIEEELLFIAWDSFAEYLRPQDEPEVAAIMQGWKI